MRMGFQRWLFATIIHQTLAQSQEHFGEPSRKCSLYLAPSTILNGGLGVFTGISMSKGDVFSTTDLAIPLVDLHKHNRVQKGNRLDSVLSNYVWHPEAMGMDREAPSGSAFAPGVHAAANCLPALINVESDVPKACSRGFHRTIDPVAGAISYYGDLRTVATRDIPSGGELFVDYGDSWFRARAMTYVPLRQELVAAKRIMLGLGKLTEKLSASFQRDFWKLIRSVPYSSIITSIFPERFEDVLMVIEHNDLGILYQANATHSIDFLKEQGTCLDAIRSQTSTIPGAGLGAFATRSFDEGDVIISSPVLHIPNHSLFQMYEKEWSVYGNWKPSATVESHQLLVNYCFGHVESKVMLCPYANGVNFINHNRSLANVRIQWTHNGRLLHNSTLLTLSASDLPKNKAALVIDYIALRDIRPGDELFLDAGATWDEAWKIHVDLWEANGDDYQPASVLNERQDPLRTRDEQRINPYPHELHCHESLIVDYYNWRSIVTHNDLWKPGQMGSRCNILSRYVDEHGEFVYDVNFFEDEDDTEVQNRGVPRNAFSFVDRYYSTDMHLPSTFRYPYQIPEAMLPSSWKTSQREILHSHKSTIERSNSNKSYM